MKYGLSAKQLQEITDILASYDNIEEAILFGSRAIDTYKEASDVDIAIKGKNADWSLAAALKAHLEEETYLPFFFDVLAYNSIQSEELKKHIHTKGKRLWSKRMSGWPEFRLGDFTKINPTEHLSKGTLAKKITMELIQPFTKKIPSYVEERYKGGAKFRNGDTIMARITPSLENGKVSYADILGDNEIGFGSTEFIVFRQKEKISDKHFIYYLITSPMVRNIAIKSMTGSSGRQRVQTDVLENYVFAAPSLPEQKAIAEVLSSLDDKINLLHRQNCTLEQMAETLFRQWFVQEAQENWEAGVLPDEFEFLMGQSPKGSSFNQEGIGMPMFQGNADFDFRFPNKRVYTTDAKRIAQKFDTLVSVRAPVGEQNMALETCCIGRGVAAFRYKANPKYYTYTYFKMRSLLNEIKQFNNEGTVFGSISKNDFQSLSISIPLQSLVDKFQHEVKPIDDRVIHNLMQICTLERLRDVLLPKLIHGEISVDVDR